jgi:hypothetical protein
MWSHFKVIAHESMEILGEIEKIRWNGLRNFSFPAGQRALSELSDGTLALCNDADHIKIPSGIGRTK